MTQKELNIIIEIVEDMFEEMIEEFSDDAIVITELMMESIKIAKECIIEGVEKVGGLKSEVRRKRTWEVWIVDC